METTTQQSCLDELESYVPQLYTKAAMYSIYTHLYGVTILAVDEGSKNIVH